MDNTLLINECFNDALDKYPYWKTRQEELRKLLREIILEIRKVERSAKNPNLADYKDLNRIRTIWSISGTGSYQKPLIDVPSDKMWLNHSWGQSTDKLRLDYSTSLIHRIKKILPENPQPVLLYNGVAEQNEVLKKVAQSKLGLKESEYFIMPGKIVRTLDQAKSFTLPPGSQLKKDDRIGIVSHAPHLIRLMKMVNIYKPFPKGARIILLPLVFETDTAENEFTKMEISGMLGYISRGEAAKQSYPYELL
jgi:hypothetical protein